MKPVHLILLTTLIVLCTGCPEPVADFEYSYTDNMAPAEVTFTNKSTDADEFMWNFGDGNTSSSTNPTHTYNEGGNFTINLRAESRYGTNEASKSIQIINPYTYAVQNLSSWTLYNVTSYYWDGEEIYDFVEHGTLYSGYKTSTISTKYNEISVILKLEPNLPTNNGWYFVSNTYYLSSQNLNLLVVDDNTYVEGPYDLKKGGLKEIHPRLKDNNNPVPIRDILIKQQLP